MPFIRFHATRSLRGIAYAKLQPSERRSAEANSVWIAKNHNNPSPIIEPPIKLCVSQS
uniref:Uncharacterized protein n=1 Tax=uncultured bacterium contig00025 TaxID=1181514 RepID=A0A806KR31_9BACT|nr:hypothetical protein [uncultured bacterium contig00025]